MNVESDVSNSLRLGLYRKLQLYSLSCARCWQPDAESSPAYVHTSPLTATQNQLGLSRDNHMTL
jgi:hypothetical protein